MTQYSQIVTPPDFIKSTNHTVVIIDPTDHELEDLALFFKTASKSFTVYAYRAELNDQAWLTDAISKAETVIINSDPNTLSPFKDRLSVDAQSYYYGQKRFLSNNKRIEHPIDWFVTHLNKEKAQLVI